MSEIEDEMEALLFQTELHKRQHLQSNYVQARSSITSALENFSQHPRLPSKENVLSFWKSKSLTEPQLCRLANVVLATPITQVSAYFHL